MQLENQIQYTQELEYRQALAPRKLKPEDKAYRTVKELTYAVNHSDCTNIAITGVYGSGKSSVLKTFLDEHEDKKILKLSLSTFFSDGNKDDKLENLVEYKLFQHILYKSDPSVTTQTRYTRIPYISKEDCVKYAVLILLFFLSFVIAYEPKLLQIPSIYTAYYGLLGNNLGNIVNTIFDIIATVYMIWCIGNCLYSGIKRYRHVSIRSIKAYDVELEFDENKSTFNLLLEEILYFFKAGGYDYVLFEDLDRITEPQQLFLKFREMNILLNESDYFIKNKRKIKFIYAIKDDVFSDEVRTKCFDYIIPVVPVVDKFYAGDYLIEKFHSNILCDIEEKELAELGLYISSMRELTNIVNEYGIYKDIVIVGDKMSFTKLLAIIIYKNLFPEDFSKLHTKQGCLYRIFENKQAFSASMTSNDEKELSSIKDEIQKTKESIIKLRRGVLGILEQEHQMVGLIIDEDQYSIEDFEKNDGLYSRFEKDMIDKYIFQNGDEYGIYKYDIKFSQLLHDAGDDSYYEEMHRAQYDLEQQENRRGELNNRISLVRKMALFDIIREIGDGNQTYSIVEDICKKYFEEKKEDEAEPKDMKKIARVLHSFIRNRYLAEDYENYISYYYPGSKKKEDFEFLQSVLQGIGLNYDHSLTNPEKVVESLQTEHFKSKECLNYNLLDYILDSKEVAIKNTIIKNARKHPDFVVGYYKHCSNVQKFVSVLFDGWNHCITDIISNSNDEHIKTLYEMLVISSPNNVSLNEKEMETFNTLYGFICNRLAKCDMKGLKEFINQHRPQFINLDTPDDSEKKFYEFIVSNKYFVINENNLKVILGETFYSAPLTAILKSEKRVKAYLDDNIVDVIELLPETATKESPNTILELAKDARIKDEQLLKFIEQQEHVFETLDDIQKERMLVFFDADKIKPTWQNIQQYHAAGLDVLLLAEYIEKHVDSLSTHDNDEKNDYPIQRALLCNNDTLTTETYKKILPQMCYNFDADEIKDLNEERLRIVLEADYIEYGKDCTSLYALKSSDLFADYLIHFYEDFRKDDDFDANITNAIGIKVLNSTLTLDQKRYWLDKVAQLDDDNDKFEYCKLICFYSKEIGAHSGMDVKMIIDSIGQLDKTEDWKLKIDIINDINSVISYDENTEKEMLDTLGGEYLELNSYRGVAHFDDNHENQLLLNYLKNQGHYVKNVKSDKGRIKVTFKNPPSTD